MLSRRSIVRYLLNIPGWRTKKKIIVFESDDWGSIRMPSPEIKKLLLERGIHVDQLSYNNYDSLATEKDLACLIEELLTVKDLKGNPCNFTLNTIVANPDFNRIRESNYTQYYYEPFIETLKRYPNHQKSFDLWMEGISRGVFRPQLHGREHINASSWMRALQENIGNTRLAFNYEMYDLSTSLMSSVHTFMSALHYIDPKEIELHHNYIIEGSDLFEQIFGYRSRSFIAPRYIWSSDLNITLKNCGIDVIQGGFYQFHPSEKKLKKIIHYTGEKNELNQCFLVRNVSFEPSENPSLDWVGSALSQISDAFAWGKPAIIGTHRANYIGYIEPENRDRNLILLRQLLKIITLKWPEVEFMSSDQLGNYIMNSKKYSGN